MSIPPHFPRSYESPNIVIVPTVSLIKKNDQTKLHYKGNPVINQNVPKGNPEAQKVSSIEKEVQIADTAGQPNVEQPKTVPKETPCNEDLNKNLANTVDLNKTKKVSNSWASNYLQSIGHNNIKPIKINISSKPKVHKIETVSTNNNTVSGPVYLQTLPLRDSTPTLPTYSDTNIIPHDNNFTGKSIVPGGNNEIAKTHANTGYFNTNENTHVHPTNETIPVRDIPLPWSENKLAKDVYMAHTNETPQKIDMPLILPWSENKSKANENVYMPYTNETPRELEMPHLLPWRDNKSTTVNPNNMVLDTIYSTTAPAYATLLGKNNDQATYCYHEGTSIYDAIRYEINNSINFTSKKYLIGKDLVKRDLASSSEAKSIDYRKSPSRRKNEDLNRHSSKYISETSLQKQSKISNESKAIKKRTSEKDRLKQSNKVSSLKREKSPKIRSNVTNKESSALKKENSTKIKSNITNQESSTKTQHMSKFTDAKDGNYRKAKQQHYDKESVRESKTINPSPERRKLKRVRYGSDDLSSLSGFSSPLQSTLQKPEKYVTDQRNKQYYEESFDLRSKLNQRINKRRLDMDQESKPLNKKPRDNLKITVENDNFAHNDSSKKSVAPKYKSKTKKCRKLKLIINVVCQESDESDNSSDSSGSENNPSNKNMDLSFLDDFNVDEIVDSLKRSPVKRKIISPLPQDNKRQADMKVEQKPSKSSLLLEKTEIVVSNPNKKESTEDFMKNNRSTSLKSSSKSKPVPNVESSINEEANKKPILNRTENNVESLVDILLTQTRFKMAQKNLQGMSPPVDESDKKCVTVKQNNVGDSNTIPDILQKRDVLIDNVIQDDHECIVDMTDIVSGVESTTVATTPKNSNKMQSSETRQLDKNAIEQDTMDKYPNKEFIEYKQSDQETNIDLESLLNIEQIQIMRDENDNNVSLTQEMKLTDVETKNDLTIVDEDQKESDSNSVLINKAIESVNEENKDVSDKPIEFNTEIVKQISAEAVDQVIHYAVEQIQDNISKNINNASLTQAIQPMDMETENGISNTSEDSVIDLTIDDEDDKSESKYLLRNEAIESVGEKSIRTFEEPIGLNTETLKQISADAVNQIIRNAIDLINYDSEVDISDMTTVTQKTQESPIPISIADNKIETSEVDKEQMNAAQEPMEINIEAVEKVNAHTKENTTNECTITQDSSSPSLSKDNKIDTSEEVLQAPDSKTESNSNEILFVKNIIKPVETVKEEAQTSKEYSNIDTKDNICKEESYKQTLEITLSTKNIKMHNEANIKMKDESIQNIIENVSEINKIPGNSKGKSPIENKCIQSKTVKKVVNLLAASLNYIKDSVDNQHAAINEHETTSETTNVSLKKDNVVSNLKGQYKALADELGERMLEYMQKQFDITSIINHGRFSTIFMCNDVNGQNYAAKVIKNVASRIELGIEREQMIRQIQQDIPKDNLNTVYLIDGFGVQRYWCHLMEYYPRNLEQALRQREKPFHIDCVQDLARQLISAVMVLRNNDVVHSDIKPSHILINATSDRIKLCGFDRAYYIDAEKALPNISTAPYRAPEVIIGFSAGFSVDVWSIALVIQEMATRKKLFNGIYNNDILYQQMCVFGDLPRDMVERSPYSNQHFNGPTFMRRVGYQGRDAVLFHKFFKTKKLQKGLMNSYNHHWSQKTAVQQNADFYKLSSMTRLLEGMLILDPRRRLAIEFVCADPFIYEMFT